MTLPVRLRALARITEGDLVEAEYLRGKIVITRKVIAARTASSVADDDYSPAQRLGD